MDLLTSGEDRGKQEEREDRPGHLGDEVSLARSR